MAMHQPNYMPWLGYFHKLMHVDVFVYLDAVQYPRGKSFAARNSIKTPGGTALLTVPVSVPAGNKGRSTYLEIDFAGDKWKAKHLKTLELNYKKAPYFNDVFPIVEESFKKATRLVDLNIDLIEGFAEYLDFGGRRVRLSGLLDQFGQKSQLIVDICNAVGANVYLSGTGGGLEYNDEKMLAESHIALEYSDFAHPTYSQLWGDFEQNLSVVDLLFNCGKDSVAFIANRKGLDAAIHQ